jgi:hypothetical protein
MTRLHGVRFCREWRLPGSRIWEDRAPSVLGLPAIRLCRVGYVYNPLVTPLRPDLGHPLPSGATIEQIAAALGEVTTARVSYHGLLGGFGRDIPVHGGGVADLSRNISSANLVIKNRPIEQLDVGGDTFRKLTTDEQQKTGRLWRWVCHCPYGDDDLWAQIVAAMPQCAWLAGDGAE